MQLTFDSNTSYLTESKACSHANGYHYLTTYPPTSPNVPLIIHCSIISATVSTTKVELGALFYNCKDASPFGLCLRNSAITKVPLS
jgi:hypothetical protein